MIKLQCLGRGVLALGVLVACGEAGHEVASEASPEDGMGEHLAEASEAESDYEAAVIGEITHEGARYQFIDAEGSVALNVEGKLANGEPALFRLVAEHGALTSLEIFYALAANDAVPDERLVAAHAEEARALERPDGAVKRVELGPQPVEKGLQADCVALARQAAQTFGNLNPAVQGRTLNAPSSLVTPTTPRGVGGALCNDAVQYGSVMRAVFQEKKSNSTKWVKMSSGDVAVGDFSMYGSAALSIGKQLRVTGSFLGSSHPYFLAVAY